jgi:hypothetical protein
MKNDLILGAVCIASTLAAVLVGFLIGLDTCGTFS